MKKLIYILVLSIAASMTITSCTEQEIKPANNPGGTGATDPKG